MTGIFTLCWIVAAPCPLQLAADDNSVLIGGLCLTENIDAYAQYLAERTLHSQSVDDVRSFLFCSC